MLKRSTSSRNQRSKGVRVKHILQIAVLLGICFWLIYQVKYSHDKRRELRGKDAKVSTTEQVSSDSLKLGRKDLKPHVEEVEGKEEKHVEEEEEDEDKHEEGAEEREIRQPEVDEREDTEKHEEEEEQEEEGKGHEVEDEETKVDDFEDQDKPRDEIDREDEFIDEEKEREEESPEDKETDEGNDEDDEEEKPGLVGEENQILAEDEAHDELDRSMHEAREVHYKEDDASSAVTHDNNQLIGSELAKFDLDFANQTNIATNTSNQYNNEDENGSKADGKEVEMTEKDLILKETGAESKDSGNEADAGNVVEDLPPGNSTVSTENIGANITPTEMNTEDLSNSSPPNGTEVILNSPQVQNSTVDGGDGNSNRTGDGNGAESLLAIANTGTGESSNSTGTGPGLAVPDQKPGSGKNVEEGSNIRLPTTTNENNENKAQSQKSEERQNESGEVKTG